MACLVSSVPSHARWWPRSPCSARGSRPRGATRTPRRTRGGPTPTGATTRPRPATSRTRASWTTVGTTPMGIELWAKPMRPRATRSRAMPRTTGAPAPATTRRRRDGRSGARPASPIRRRPATTIAGRLRASARRRPALRVTCPCATDRPAARGCQRVHACVNLSLLCPSGRCGACPRSARRCPSDPRASPLRRRPPRDR